MRNLLGLFVLFFSVTCASAPPVTEVFEPAKLQAMDAAVEDAIAKRIIPGGVLWVERDGAIYGRAYGNRATVPSVESITPDTIYDAASLTKVVATSPSIWRLVERGKIDIDAPVKTYIPEFAGGWRDEVTVRHLLTHTSGLRAGISLADKWSGYEEGVKRAAAEQPRHRPGATFLYSDINYILLGDIVRRVSGEPLDVFARKNIFEPLGMRDTSFRPARSVRIAPTERVEGIVLRSEVHDPTSRRMGGVAGHAGMFTTAEDLARFARAVLEGTFPAAMTAVQTPPGVAVRRAGGFDIDSSYSWPRGAFPLGSFGHTGYTGPSIWIDPASRTFVIFMTNRVHPDDRGSLSALRRTLGTLAANMPSRELPRVRWVLGGGNAQNGIDTLASSQYEPLRGLRIGLITNHTGIDKLGNPTIDLLRSAPNVTLAALFSPEHGIRGALDDKVTDDRDAVTGLPIYSLYGERRKPSAEQLANLDALVFDIQDIGARFYTYISTLGMAMEAAAESKKKFFVLDRVNPIGGTLVEGPVLEGPADFVAYHPIVIRHGMTVGELAKMFKDEKKLDLDLTVVALKNWKREQWQDEAGLPWINTSPNMRSLEAAGLYPGIGLMESALSVGRGTPTPFEVLGAPYIDGAKLVAELEALKLPGIRFQAASFTPDASIHKGEACGGIRMTITDRRTFHAVDAGIAIATTIERLYPEQFDEKKMTRLLRHPATLDAIRAGKPLSEIRELWKSDFGERRAKYVMY
jgi:uncharacterized protein YbbC (DUF1343 family)/CubicO group peptidase (beta-lactamase class C family)